ncbi:MAG: hypothetical protein H0T15_06360 [Thermoleophilaceae bacterium]|nr:hypothetical protein [Thermoleophilaceae bacterium]
MPEVRIDPLSGLKTIVAGERAERPGGGFSAPPVEPLDPESDPFLEGHEDRTPPEVDADRPGGGAPDTPGWRVRVVPNLYPALTPAVGDGLADPLASGRGEPDLFASAPAAGAHEVVVNSPRPVTSISSLDEDEAGAALDMWRRRIRAHPEARYVHVIVNEQRTGGASLAHTHSQVYALPFVPAAVARERERFTAYAERTQGRNLLEDLLGEEVRRRERVVAVGEDAVAICPWASRVPFQVQLIPRRPRGRFEDDGPLGASTLLEVLRRLESVLGGPPPLNMWVRTAPHGAEWFCWRIDVMPRLTYLAGLEMGAGVNLNIVPPERAAQLLRDSDPA